MKWISIVDGTPNEKIPAVNLLLADKNGGVWPGTYTEGKFMVFGVEHPYITHWMPYPDPPARFIKGEINDQIQTL